jgi:peptidoglycan hydrolase-like amidase
MCQVGALRKARLGEEYTQILSTYYPGTELKIIRMEDE